MPVRSREIHALSSRIQLPVLRKLLSIMDGHHSALRHGRGWEFMDLAPYQPGDDVREIDWAATARTGSPIIKRHEATANLQVMLVVDTGREMGALAPSGETKEEVALAACEVIAWLSAARGDQIGLVAGDDKRVRFMPARSGNAHAETLLRRIEEDITLRSPHANVAKLLARARTITRRRSLIVIVTDSTQPTASPESSDLIKSMSARHQVILISVEDIDPTTLSEGTEVVDVNEGPLPDFLLRDHQLAGEAANVMAMRRAAVARMLDERGVIHVDVSSSEDIPRALMRALERAVKQYRAGSDNDTLEAVAGLIDEGENPKEAAFREMLEETGYDTHTIESFYDITKKTAFYVSPGYSTEKLYFYIAKLKKDALAKEQKLDIGEDIEVVKISINNALEDTDDLKTVYILEKLISLIKENSI